MKRVREAMKGQVNLNTLLSGLILVASGFALNKADHIYTTLINLDAWKTQHMEVTDKQSKAISDLSLRLTGDETTIARTSMQIRQITNRLGAVEKKIGL